MKRTTFCLFNSVLLLCCIQAFSTNAAALQQATEPPSIRSSQQANMPKIPTQSKLPTIAQAVQSPLDVPENVPLVQKPAAVAPAIVSAESIQAAALQSATNATVGTESGQPHAGPGMVTAPPVIAAPQVVQAPRVVTAPKIVDGSTVSTDAENPTAPLNLPPVIGAPQVVAAPPIQEAPSAGSTPAGEGPETPADELPLAANSLIVPARPVVGRGEPLADNRTVQNPSAIEDDADKDANSLIAAVPPVTVPGNEIQPAGSIEPLQESPVRAMPIQSAPIQSMPQDSSAPPLPPILSRAPRIGSEQPTTEQQRIPANVPIVAKADLPPVVSRPTFDDPVAGEQPLVISPNGRPRFNQPEPALETAGSVIAPDTAPARTRVASRLRNSRLFEGMRNRVGGQDSIVEPAMPDPLPSGEIVLDAPVPQPSATGNTYFDGDPNSLVELGQGVSKYSGVSVVGDIPIDGGCGGCGQCAGCNSPRCQYDVDNVCAAFNCCGFIASARRYYQLEFLYWANEANPIVGSNFFATNDLDWSPGGRITVGQKDGVRGREFIYTGFDTWRSSNQSTIFGLMNGNFLTATLPAAAVDPFFDANQQFQIHKSRFHSVELNRTWWGWDVVKTTLGARYMHFGEDYQLISQDTLGVDPLGLRGDLFLDAENNFFGPQLGMELYYDVGRRVALTFSSKIAGYANVHRTAIAASNSGISILDNRDNSVEFSYSFEFGMSGHWKLGPRARLIGGYDVLGIYEVNTAARTFPSFLTPVSGRLSDPSDNVYLHGFSFGIEIFR